MKATLMAASAAAFAFAAFAADTPSSTAPAEKFRMRSICKQGFHENSPFPGNSIPAFKLAWEKGAGMIETDCHMIRGGRIICVHDRKVLARLSGEDRVIPDLTEEDVAKIDIGKSSKSPEPVRIPYLEEVFATMPKYAIAQCEICGYSDTFADTFDRLRREAGLSVTNIFMTSAGLSKLADFKKRYPEYRTGWLNAGLGVKGAKTYSVDAMIAAAKKANVDVVCPRALLAQRLGFSPADADKVRAAGLEFRVWGVNTPELLKYAYSLKVPAFTCARWSESFKWAKDIPGVEVVP